MAPEDPGPGSLTQQNGPFTAFNPTSHGGMVWTMENVPLDSGETGRFEVRATLAQDDTYVSIVTDLDAELETGETVQVWHLDNRGGLTGFDGGVPGAFYLFDEGSLLPNNQIEFSGADLRDVDDNAMAITLRGTLNI